MHAVEVIGEETSEEGKTDSKMETGDMPVHKVEGGDSFLEDYPGDSFEKVGEINLEKTPRTPSEPILSIPSDETPTTTEPRKKRIKTLTGRTDLPWLWKMLAQQSQTSPSSHQPSTKQPSQPTCKSHRLAAQGFVRRSSSTKQRPLVIKEIVSSSEGSPIKNPETPAAPLVLPVLESEQASTETSPVSKQTPTSWPVLKRKATSKEGSASKPAEEPSFKKAKTSVTPIKIREVSQERSCEG